MQIEAVARSEVEIRGDLGSLKVLVVDDETSIREALQSYLYHLGIPTVHTAQNGKIALEALNTEKYDYLFMDLMMPEMDGMELLKNLDSNGRPMSIIVMTGFPSMEKVIEAMRNGASDFLIKPFRLQDLKISMERVHRLHRLAKKNWILKRQLEQKRQVEKLNQELQVKIREKTLLYDIIDSLSKVNRSDDLYGYLVKKALEVCDASKACFFLYDQERSGLIALSQKGLQSVRPGHQVSLEPDPHGNRCMAPDFVKAHFQGEHIGKVSIDRPLYSPDLLSVPFRIRQEFFGVMLIGGKGNGGAFSEEDQFLMNFLAERTAQNIENLALYDSLKENLFATLGALVSAIEARDPYTRQHSQRVTQVALRIAQAMDRPFEDCRRLESSGPLHDIGKIGIDDHILKKPDRLTEEEFKNIQAHPLIGVHIVSPLGLDEQELAVIRNHHERWDGKGYPDGLKGTDIPLLARILSVADAFDAMNSDRAYRKALPFEHCLEELVKNKGAQFDPEVVDAALRVLKPYTHE
ncbi:MAG: HD domain-containing response regulator [Deltaproteobacteria bacterium]|nr:HD domain-containing response regulator [Deltaproteobacteria bacterium]